MVIEKPDILMLALNDWANTGWRYTQCLKLLGLNVVYLKGKRHNLSYPSQGKIDKDLLNLKLDDPINIAMARRAKAIHYIASTFVDIPTVNLKKKFVVVNHGGSVYRIRHKRLNPIFNPIVNVSICQMPELTKLGCKNPVYISFPVDTDFIQPNFNRKDPKKILIGHFPTSFVVKGTDRILKTLNALGRDPEVGKRFKYVGSIPTGPQKKILRRKWEKNLEEMKNCDIIIDACNPKQKGHPYGEWGNTVMESAACGAIPITHSLLSNIYVNEYGELPIYIANNPKQLFASLKNLLLMNDKEILEEKQKMRTWVEEKHSFAKTAEYLKEKVYGEVFNL